MSGGGRHLGSTTVPEPADGRKNSTQRSHDRLTCVFCRIVDGNESKSADKILFQDDEFVVFPDIRPASKHHLLVVTKEHIKDAKSITEATLLDRMVGVGRKVLDERIQEESPTNPTVSTTSADDATSTALVGFHWPPFHTVAHLHLHVIYPPQDMGFIGRIIFRPNSYWFVQPSWVKQRLTKSNPGIQGGSS